MKSERRDEILSNLQRAQESLQAARELLGNNYYDIAASRAYYAAFYAATALLLNSSLEFSKHSGVIAAVHQHFIKTSKMDQRFGKDLNWLFELRSVGDYGVVIHVSQDEAKEAIVCAGEFVAMVKSVLHA